jgi:hypothetical protein
MPRNWRTAGAEVCIKPFRVPLDVRTCRESFWWDDVRGAAIVEAHRRRRVVMALTADMSKTESLFVDL